MNAGGIPAFHCPARSSLCGRILRVGEEAWRSGALPGAGRQGTGGERERKGRRS